MMFWAKEVELINLEAMSEGQRIPGYSTGCQAHRILYSSTEEGGFQSFLSCTGPKHGDIGVKWR